MILTEHFALTCAAKHCLDSTTEFWLHSSTHCLHSSNVLRGEILKEWNRQEWTNSTRTRGPTGKVWHMRREASMILDWTEDHQEGEKKMNRHKNHSLVTFTAVWYSIMVKYQSKSVVERMEVIFIVFLFYKCLRLFSEKWPFFLLPVLPPTFLSLRFKVC